MRYLLFCLLIINYSLNAQVGISTDSPDTTSALDINNQNALGFGGLKLPTVTEAQRSMIAVDATSEGIIVYVIYPNGNRCLEIYDALGNTWQAINCTNTATELIISEYVEADGNNKFIELYNPTLAAIDLSSYKIVILRDGGTFPIDGSDRDISLSGTIAAGSTFVIANALQTLLPLGSIDLIIPNAGNPLDFSGDDPVLLTDLSNTIIDIIGIPGTDPGTGYAVDGQDTENNTIRRISSITQPNSTWTPSEWTACPNNDVSGLGTR